MEEKKLPERSFPLTIRDGNLKLFVLVAASRVPSFDCSQGRYILPHARTDLNLDGVFPPERVTVKTKA